MTQIETKTLITILKGFTPGPWWAYCDDDIGCYRVKTVPENLRAYDNGNPIATLPMCSIGDPLSENAALIAAAPDLHRIATDQAAEIARMRGALGDIFDGEPQWPDNPKKELKWCRKRAEEAYRNTGEQP